jgi:hypothetical protein
MSNGGKPTCKGVTKAGRPCQSTVLVDGEYCLVHSSRPFDPVETGRIGGRKSVEAKRARKEIAPEPGVDGREKLRAEFERDDDAYDRLKAAYLGGLEAVTTCPSCREKALRDHRTRIAAGDSFLAQLYGKPRQEVNQTVNKKVQLALFVVPDWFYELEMEARRRGEEPEFGGQPISPRSQYEAGPRAATELTYNPIVPPHRRLDVPDVIDIEPSAVSGSDTDVKVPPEHDGVESHESDRGVVLSAEPEDERAEKTSYLVGPNAIVVDERPF